MPDRAHLRPVVTAEDRREDDARLWRAVAVFRVLSLAYAVALFVRVQEEYSRPGGAWLVLAGMAAWTLVLTAMPQPGPAWRVADLVLACAAVLATAVLDDPQRVQDGAQTLPSIWVASAVLGWAVAGGWAAGLAAALALSAADLIVAQGQLSPSTVNNIVLLLLAGTIVGYAAQLYRRGRRELALAVSAEAATHERERLARDIHDSVLQVLAYVQRRGRQLGGEAAELGRLAGEQEARLRSLVAAGPTTTSAHGQQDVRAALNALAGSRVTVVAPAEPVLLPSPKVAGITAAVQEALANVARHAGEEASTWILVEDDEGEVTVTVRDDGVGFPAGRLEAAAAEGRLGVASSILGRVAELGGSASVTSRPGEGTEVELAVRRSR